MPYGDSVGFGDMGWTGIPSVVTTASGTNGGMAIGNGAAQGQGSANSGSSCALCSNPKVQEMLFILAVILIAVGWHFHLFSLLEEG
jgi:F0F1-type ATP synthase membrane subunit c/vacuolar-type H+-ATPase subunit K